MQTEQRATNQVYYLSHQAQDEQWGIICTAVGSRICGPDSSFNSPAPERLEPTRLPHRGRSLGEYQLIYITEGQGFFCNDEINITRLSAGDIILIPPYVEHSIVPDSATGWSQMWVNFRGDEHLSGVIDSFFNPGSPVIRFGISDTVCDIFARILNLGKNEKLGVQQAIGGFVYALLGYIRYKVANSIVSQSRYSDKVQQARLMIRENLVGGISPSEVAAKLGMSYSLLRQQFHALTGISMSEYFIRQRINLAKSLLSSTDKTVKEIAFESGYDSVSRFCTAFTQYSGLTASEFRKRNRQRNPHPSNHNQ